MIGVSVSVEVCVGVRFGLRLGSPVIILAVLVIQQRRGLVCSLSERRRCCAAGCGRGGRGRGWSKHAVQSDVIALRGLWCAVQLGGQKSVLVLRAVDLGKRRKITDQNVFRTAPYVTAAKEAEHEVASAKPSSFICSEIQHTGTEVQTRTYP